MKTLRLFFLELGRLLHGRLTWLVLLLTAVSPAAGLVLYKPADAATMLSMFREVVFGVGFALLLPVFFGLDGVLYSMPVSDVLTFLIAVFIICKTYGKLNTEGTELI